MNLWFSVSLMKRMDNVKRHNETVSDFIHRVVCDKVYELERDEKNGRMD
jgi:hypothetical protein